MRIQSTPAARRDLKTLESLSEQNVSLCMQCGTCSGACPNTGEMDLTPRAVVHLAQLGQLDRALACQTIWTCSACLQCSALCPRGLDLARLMEGLRSLNLRRRQGSLKPEDLPAACTDAPPVLLISALRKLTG